MQQLWQPILRWLHSDLSIYGQVKTKERSQMGHSKGDKLVYCKQALALKDKLQTASYKAKVEKWDSDSNSDESDDEADLSALIL